MTDEEKDLQLQIRCLVSTVDDLQSVRISVGNRIVQSFYSQMGIKPGKKIESGDSDSVKMIQQLKEEYNKVTNLMVENNRSIKKQLSTLPENITLNFIKNELDYKMIKQYEDALKCEQDSIKILKKYVHLHPMWERFFKDIPGCGEVMAARCLAYLNIDTARHVSSFWKYCGIDTVVSKDAEGNVLYSPIGGEKVQLRVKKKYIDEYGNVYKGGVKASGICDEYGEYLYYGTNSEKLKEVIVTKMVDDVPTVVYENIESGEEYIGEVQELRHGRKKGDVELREYVDKDGKIQKKRSITYNKKLKATLLVVLSGCIIKAGQRYGYNKYEECYRDNKYRLENNPKHKGKSKVHINRMAIRYMIKEFLRDLWVEWRTYEGYEISEPYEVAYLNRKPHKYNEAHVVKANKV